jgi:apolipoprotein N-acyltransferase
MAIHGWRGCVWARVAGARGLLLTGSVDVDIKDQMEGGQNVITGLDEHGHIVGSYAKAHLVPYGEYLPMRPPGAAGPCAIGAG